MRNRRIQEEALSLDDEDTDGSGGLRRSRKDLFALAAAALAALTIMINALFLQKGPHPAPIFANKPPAPVASAPAAQKPAATASLPAGDTTGAVALPRPRPAEREAPRADAPARPRAEIIADIQKELARRGFYEGAADGLYGSKTDAAIRDFEQVAALKAGSEPGEDMLRTIARSNVRARPAAAQPRPDPIAELLAPRNRVVAVQRVLSEYGYGQLKTNGVVDADTQAAIQKFERARKLPVTGQISDGLVRDLAAMTGRPLD